MSVDVGTATIIRGNALDLSLADNSVDLVVTSPPYFGLRSYQDGGEHCDGQLGAESTPAAFVDALLEATREMVRVTKSSGSLWINLGDKYSQPGKGERNGQGIGGSIVHKAGTATPNRSARDFDYNGVRGKSLIGIPWRYALACIDQLGLILRAEVIWSKPNGLPESVTDRVRRSHEQWFHFTLQPRYYSAVDEIREPHAREWTGSWGKNGGHKYADAAMQHGRQQRLAESEPHTLGKLPGSVWTIPTQPLTVPAHLGVDHFAAFPAEWPKRLILGWSPVGGCVLDPFGGTGTTALAAKALGRHGISVDLSADYCRLATWRTNNLDELARVGGVKRSDHARAADHNGMDTLFDIPSTTGTVA